MSETTRALAKLPSMDVELVHDKSEEGVERLAIRLTGRPDLKTAAKVVEQGLLPALAAALPLTPQQNPFLRAMAPWLRLNPFLAPLLPPPDRRD